MDIKQMRTDFDRGMLISHYALAELIAHAEQADAVLSGRQQAIGALNMRVAELEARAVVVPRVPSNPAAHDWAAPVMQAGVQEGWQLVPVIATDAMAAAAINTRLASGNVCLNGLDIWGAMLAAAPSAPVSAQWPAMIDVGNFLVNLIGISDSSRRGVGARVHDMRKLCIDFQRKHKLSSALNVCTPPSAPHAVAAPERDAPPLPQDSIAAMLEEYASNPGYSHNDYADSMREASNAIHAFTKWAEGRGYTTTPQPIAAPATDPMDDRWHSLTCDGTFSPPCAATQQPLPAQSIDSPAFRKLQIAMASDFCNETKHKAIIDYIDTWAARLSQQLVDAETQRFSEIAQTRERGFANQLEAEIARLSQPRALSDDEILMIARQEGMATHDCANNPMDYAVGFARCLLAAAGAA